MLLLLNADSKRANYFVTFRNHHVVVFRVLIKMIYFRGFRISIGRNQLLLSVVIVDKVGNNKSRTSGANRACTRRVGGEGITRPCARKTTIPVGWQRHLFVKLRRVVRSKTDPKCLRCVSKAVGENDAAPYIIGIRYCCNVNRILWSLFSSRNTVCAFFFYINIDQFPFSQSFQ